MERIEKVNHLGDLGVEDRLIPDIKPVEQEDVVLRDLDIDEIAVDDTRLVELYHWLTRRAF